MRSLPSLDLRWLLLLLPLSAFGATVLIACDSSDDDTTTAGG